MFRTVTIEKDKEAECPNTRELDWRLIVFNAKSRYAGDPEQYLKKEQYGRIHLASTWLKQKESEGLLFSVEYKNQAKSSFYAKPKYSERTHNLDTCIGILFWGCARRHMVYSTYQERLKDARAFLDQINDWENGKVYQITIKTDNEQQLTIGGLYKNDITEAIIENTKPDDVVIVTGTYFHLFDERKFSAQESV